MKRSGSNFIIPLVIYPFDIIVSIGETDDEFQKTIRKRLPPSCIKDLEGDSSILKLGYTTDARTVNLSTTHQTIIRFKRFPKTGRDHGIVAHEAFHAISFILWRMGINLEIEKTDECYAYLLDYVITEIYKKL
jgi:hypothetical protein